MKPAEHRIVVTDEGGEELFRGPVADFLSANADPVCVEEVQDAVTAALAGGVGLIGGGAAPAVFVVREPVEGTSGFPCMVCETVHADMEGAERCEKSHEERPAHATESQRALVKRVARAKGYTALDNGERIALALLWKWGILARESRGTCFVYRLHPNVVRRERERRAAKSA